MNRLATEYRVFLACPQPMRILLIANMIFALVMPVIDIFTAAYVMRNSHDVSLVVAYQLAVYTAIPAAFLLNGCLLNRVGIRNLYAFGMLLSGASLVAMMAPGAISGARIILSGLFLGSATGFFAANRVLLAMSATEDGNRNYYYGFEMFFYTLSSVLVPLAVGWLIDSTAMYGWFGGIRNHAYRAVGACGCTLAVIAAAILYRGRFANPPRAPFLFVRFHALWRKMLWLAVLKGLAQGYIVTAPAMLVMLLVGSEGTLGLVQAAGGILSAFLLYGAGRLAKPQHRLGVFAAGLLLFAVGSVFNALLFNSAGVLIFMASLMLARPLLDLAYFPIQLYVIDTVSGIEERGRFAYILNHEIGLYFGRAVGCGLFIALATYFSDAAALRFALLAIAVLQLVSIWVARSTLAGARLAAPAAARVTLNEMAAT